MTKPYKITSQVQVGRTSDGRFTRLVAEAPPQVIDETIRKGVDLNAAIREARVPDRLVGTGAPKNVAPIGAKTRAPVYPDAIPWPKAGPVNDANRKPFKV